MRDPLSEANQKEKDSKWYSLYVESKAWLREFPGGPGLSTFTAEARIQSLVGELRSWRPNRVVKNNTKTWYKWACLWNTNCSHGHREQTDGCRGEGGWVRAGVGGGVSRCTLSYRGWINSKVLLYSAENYSQHPMVNCNGREYVKRNVFAVQQQLTQRCKSAIL